MSLNTKTHVFRVNRVKSLDRKKADFSGFFKTIACRPLKIDATPLLIHLLEGTNELPLLLTWSIK